MHVSFWRIRPNRSCHISWAAGIAVSALLAPLWAAPVAAAETCKPEQFAKLVDETGAYLRQFAGQKRPVLHGKLQALGKKKGWPAEFAIEKGYAFVQDATIKKLDGKARKLVIQLDEIDSNSADNHSCQQLETLKTVTRDLRSATQQKFAHMVKRVDRALKGPRKPQRSVSNQISPKTSTRTPLGNVQKPPSNTLKLAPWRTQTEAPPVSFGDPLVVATPQTTTYSAREIREAGRGFFGNISANLANVIRYAFKTYGQPNGIIFGTEGGGAFLAGVNYGKGRLITKLADPIRVYWQSPTVGYDLGVQTGRVMLLVYNLRQPENIFRRFAGIGGSAYIVGGAGITVHKRGRVILAPIRTGVGLRIGANIGYMKFTPNPSINPF